MSRPPIVLVEPDRSRRGGLARGLTVAGYEVVPAVSAAEGLRFALGLDTALVVAPAQLLHNTGGDQEPLLGRLLAPGGGRRRAVVLLGDGEDGEAGLPEGTYFLPAAGLSDTEILLRLRLLLTGVELGVAADWRLGSLVGDLAAMPVLDLLRAAERVRLTGRLVLERGTFSLEDGQVVAAEAGAARGLKAACRLGRLREGPFWVLLGPPGVPQEITEELASLVNLIIEDALTELPDRHSRLELKPSEDFFSLDLTRTERRILTLAQRGASLGAVLDALPERDGELAQAVVRLERQGLLRLHRPAPVVRVVTDSTADLPKSLAAEHGITVVPLAVHFGDTRYLDRLDLQPADFYRLLAERPEHPSSSPPRPEAFAQLYRRCLEDSDVVSVHLSSALSETHAHALEGAAAVAAGVAGRTLQVVDSRQVSFGLGLLALIAARLARRGLAAAEIAAHLERMRERVHTLFVVDTLDFLARGGRIGRARALLGKLLRIKPILGLEAGEVAPVDRVRGGRAAHPRILELLAGRLQAGRPVLAAIAHADAPVWADRLRQLLEAELEVSELIQGEMGPVVGTHAGPGTVGVAVFQPSAEEAPLVAPLESAGTAPTPGDPSGDESAEGEGVAAAVDGGEERLAGAAG